MSRHAEGKVAFSPGVEILSPDISEVFTTVVQVLGFGAARVDASPSSPYGCAPKCLVLVWNIGPYTVDSGACFALLDIVP